jgi:hypothetical protein
MARYFFHVSNGQNLPDESGMNFPGAQEARKEAIRTASDLLRGDGEDFWSGIQNRSYGNRGRAQPFKR